MFISPRAKVFARGLTCAPGGYNHGDWDKWQVAGQRMNGYEFVFCAEQIVERERKRDVDCTCRYCDEYSWISVRNGQCTIDCRKSRE